MESMQPVEGLEVPSSRRLPWRFIAHRPHQTTCGSHYDAADVISIYASVGGSFQDQTAKFGSYLQDVLHQNLAKWRQEKYRNMDLLQTVAVDYAVIGRRDEGLRFFALNLNLLIPNLQSHNVDPNACLDALENLVDQVPVSAL